MDLSQEAGVGHTAESPGAAAGMVLLTLASAQFLGQVTHPVRNPTLR
jgi:hypothetical protein